MMMKLYGYVQSTATHRVRMTLNEKNVPFTFVNIDLAKGEHKLPEFLAKHPFGVVPYIDDDGFILCESYAICRYIATKYASQGPKLIPTDLQNAARFEQAASVEASYYSTHTGTIVLEKIVKPQMGLTPDEACFTEAVKKLNQTLDIYEVFLGKQKYIAGDEFTLADIFHIPSGATIALAGVDISARGPNVARWWKEINARPSWLAVQAETDIKA